MKDGDQINLKWILFKLYSYVKLARLNQPIGIFLLLWPTLWALCISNEGQIRLDKFLIFLVGVTTMRSAGCVINDYFDRDIDGKIERTKTRPLVSGEISQIEAITLFMLLILASSLLLTFLNHKAFWCAIIIIPFVVSYPLMKRLTFLPQLHLAFTFSWGIPMAYLSNNAMVDLTFFHLFLANMVLVLMYDTQYALADQPSDIKAGVKSSAILFGNDAPLIICILQALFIILIFQIGILEGLSFYTSVALVLTTFIFSYQHRLIRKKSTESYIRAFKTNNIIGLVIFCGLFIGYHIN